MAQKFLNGIDVSSTTVINGDNLSNGSTVLDVQGSQGQLFSVTNSLTGDLFAVSDISGIPILNVNSSGNVDIDGKFGINNNNPSYSLDLDLDSVNDRINITAGGVQKALINGYGNIVAYGTLTSYSNSLGGGGGTFVYKGGMATQTIGHQFKHVSGNFTGSTGDQTMMQIDPTINQTSTAGYTGIKLNVTESATGSGTKNLIDLQVGSNSKFSVNNAGEGTFTGNVTIDRSTDGSLIFESSGTSKFLVGYDSSPTAGFRIYNYVASETALFIDATSSNATFAGTITSGNITSQTTGGAALSLRRDDTSISGTNTLGSIAFQGDDPTDGTFNNGAAIFGKADGSWGSGAYPGQLLLQTRNTSGSLVTALTLAKDQNATFAGEVTFKPKHYAATDDLNSDSRSIFSTHSTNNTTSNRPINYSSVYTLGGSTGNALQISTNEDYSESGMWIRQYNQNGASPQGTGWQNWAEVHTTNSFTVANVLNSNVTDFVSKANGGTFTGDLNVHSGAGTGALSVGRTSDQAIKLHVNDTVNTIFAYQDSDSNGDHQFILRRDFQGTGASDFKIQNGSTSQLLINKDGQVTIPGNAIISGNLTVDGTTTTLNTETVEVEDNIIVLNKTASDGSATASTSGIAINRGGTTADASFIFDESDDVWDLTHNLKVVGDVVGASFAVPSGASTGFLKADGSVDSTTYLASIPSHNHDDRYYTETESTSLFTRKYDFSPGNGGSGRWFIKLFTINDYDSSVVGKISSAGDYGDSDRATYEIQIATRNNISFDVYQLSTDAVSDDYNFYYKLVSGSYEIWLEMGDYNQTNTFTKFSQYGTVAFNFNGGTQTTPSGLTSVTKAKIYHEGHKPTLSELGFDTFDSTADLTSPDAESGTWTDGNATNWGSPRIGTSASVYNDTNGQLEFNVPTGIKTAYLSHLTWSSGGYLDIYGKQADGDLVFLRRINTKQTVENSNHGDTVDHDGSTIAFVGHVGSFPSIRIINKSGRAHLTGLGWSKSELVAAEGTGMVNYSQLEGVVPTWNQNTTGNAATASAVPYSGLTGTVPTWNQNTTGSSGSCTGNAATASAVAWGNITSRPYIVNASNNSSTATTTIAGVAHATYSAAFFDFVIKNGTNVRAGTVYACHNGASTPLVEFAETSTVDLGDTSDVTLSVDISGTNMRLRATTTSSTWTIKTLIRAI